jgi:hypothetical protein
MEGVPCTLLFRLLIGSNVDVIGTLKTSPLCLDPLAYTRARTAHSSRASAHASGHQAYNRLEKMTHTSTARTAISSGVADGYGSEQYCKQLTHPLLQYSTYNNEGSSGKSTRLQNRRA